MRNSKGEVIIQDNLLMKIINEKNSTQQKLLKRLQDKSLKLEDFPYTEELKGRYKVLNEIISLITSNIE